MFFAQRQRTEWLEFFPRRREMLFFVFFLLLGILDIKSLSLTLFRRARCAHRFARCRIYTLDSVSPVNCWLFFAFFPPVWQNKGIELLWSNFNRMKVHRIINPNSSHFRGVYRETTTFLSNLCECHRCKHRSMEMSISWVSSELEVHWRQSKSKPKMENIIYEFRVKIVRSDPEVWRRIHLIDDHTMKHLASAIIQSFGWSRSLVRSEVFESPAGTLRPSRCHRIKDLFSELHDRMNYVIVNPSGEWPHQIRFLRRIKFVRRKIDDYYGIAESRRSFPICVSGRHVRPPEKIQCTIADFNEMRAILKGPQDDRYYRLLRRMQSWAKCDRIYFDASDRLIKTSALGWLFLIGSNEMWMPDAAWMYAQTQKWINVRCSFLLVLFLLKSYTFPQFLFMQSLNTTSDRLFLSLTRISGRRNWMAEIIRVDISSTAFPSWNAECSLHETVVNWMFGANIFSLSDSLRFSFANRWTSSWTSGLENSGSASDESDWILTTCPSLEYFIRGTANIKSLKTK